MLPFEEPLSLSNKSNNSERAMMVNDEDSEW